MLLWRLYLQKIPSKLSGVDVLITAGHPNFKKTGLKVESVIKLDKGETELQPC